MYQEAFSLFWRTSRFAFEQVDVLTRFLGYLSEAQKRNLKNIVICHRFRSYSLHPEYYQAYEPPKLKWASCLTDQAIFSSLRSLKSFELHLNLCSHGDVIDYMRTFRTHFKQFEPLRLLSLDDASVTVSVCDEIYRTPIQLKDGERISLTRSFRGRLVTSTRTTQDMADILQDEIGALKFSVSVSEMNFKASEWKIKDLLREAAEIQAEAGQHQLKVDEDRNELERLQTVLSRNDPSEMDKEVQLRTGEYLELSGSDRANVIES